LDQVVLDVELHESIFGAGQDLGFDLLKALLRRVEVTDLH